MCSAYRRRPTCQLAWSSVAAVFIISSTRLRLRCWHWVVTVLSVAKEGRVSVAASGARTGRCRRGSILLRRHVTAGSGTEQIALSSIVIETPIASASPRRRARRVAAVPVGTVSVLVSVLIVSEARGGRHGWALVGGRGGARAHARARGQTGNWRLALRHVVPGLLVRGHRVAEGLLGVGVLVGILLLLAKETHFELSEAVNMRLVEGKGG